MAGDGFVHGPPGGTCIGCLQSVGSRHTVACPRVLIDALHVLLDDAGVDRQNRAQSKAASKTYSVLERVKELIGERDRAVEAEKRLRDAHRITVEKAGELRRQVAAYESNDGVIHDSETCMHELCIADRES